MRFISLNTVEGINASKIDTTQSSYQKEYPFLTESPDRYSFFILDDTIVFSINHDCVPFVEFIHIRDKNDSGHFLRVYDKTALIEKVIDGIWFDQANAILKEIDKAVNKEQKKQQKELQTELDFFKKQFLNRNMK